MQFNNDLFKGADDIERRGYLSTTHYEFFGLTLQQVPEAVLKINQLLNMVKFDRIIEIGAGDGGLSYLVALRCKIKGIPFHSFDIHDKGANIKELREITDGFEVKDVIFNPENVEYVANLIKGNGRTLCIFDAGKHVEANIYFQYMKPGDCCMLHDFAKDEKHFEENIKGKVWNWLECTYAQIEEEADKNGIVFSDWMEGQMWGFGFKPENKKE